MFAQLMGWRWSDSGSMGVSGLVATPIVVSLVAMMAQLVAPTSSDTLVTYAAPMVPVSHKPALSQDRRPARPHLRTAQRPESPAPSDGISLGDLLQPARSPAHTSFRTPPDVAPQFASSITTMGADVTTRILQPESPSLDFVQKGMNRRDLQILGQMGNQRISPQIVLGGVPGQELTVAIRFSVDKQGATRDIEVIDLSTTTSDEGFNDRLVRHTLSQVAKWQFSPEGHDQADGSRHFIVGIRRAVGVAPELTYIQPSI